jgi:hypothetical protein
MFERYQNRNFDLLSAILYSSLFFVIGLYGFEYLFRETTRRIYFNILSLLFVLVLALLAIAMIRAYSSEMKNVLDTDGWLERLLVLSTLTVLFSQTLFFYSKSLPVIPWWGYALVTLSAGYLAARFSGSKVILAVFSLAAMAFFAWLIFTTPMDYKAANMLPIIDEAAKEILQGNNPYHHYAVATPPLGYLPGLILPYVPFTALGFDLRIANLLLLFLILLLFIQLARGQGASAPILAIAIGSPLVSAPMAQMIIHGHLFSYWVLLLAFVLLLVYRKYFLSSLVLGLAFATRQTAFVPAFIYFIFILSKFGFRKLIIHSVTFILPFWMMSGADLWTDCYINLFHTDKTISIFPPFFQISLSTFFIKNNLTNLLFLIQILLLLTAGFLTYRSIPSSGIAFMLASAGFSYIFFVLFSFYIARYMYFHGLLLIGCCLLLLCNESIQEKSSLSHFSHNRAPT